MDKELTPEEQKAAEAQAAKDKKAAEKEADKAAKAAGREEAKAKKAAEREAEKAKKAAEREEAKARKEAEREAAKAAKPATVAQNGVTRPNKGSTLRVWEIADKISVDKKAPAERKEVAEEGLKEGLVLGTIHTQYGRWRKFHGLTSQREINKAEKAKAAKTTEQPGDDSAAE